MKNIQQTYKIGIDIGSTTLKIVVLDSCDKSVYTAYRRHKTDIHGTFADELTKVADSLPDSNFAVAITGSAGMGISERSGIPFVQEVVASIKVVNKEYPDAYTLIDLGGEDAKMVFFNKTGHPDIRMNGSCAGGTGAFIDQMADLLNIPVEQLGETALSYEKIYPVASRCGVFAKTDVQNLISRGVPVSDICMSILHTVALQTITSLARGCDIEPKIICIGGPLTFIPALRSSFKEVLALQESDFIIPEKGEFFPAWGTALESVSQENNKIVSSQSLLQLIPDSTTQQIKTADTLAPLFSSDEEYTYWLRSRNIKPLPVRKLEKLSGETVDCFLGIDSGSTTTKIVITDRQGDILYTFYDKNEGNPLRKVVEGLEKFFDKTTQYSITVNFLSSAATGYGEDLIKSALGLSHGIVETMAHLSGAQFVDPDVSFILDIGGQDIKSIFITDGVISNIELNEACSSGCGSFLQNFASTMNMSLADFTHAACMSEQPCDLGSRCTVFMNSKVKQSLRENSSIGDIAAGLAYSVVKNCLFKVLKISNLNQLGANIVVQGGTFRNDSVYRALEIMSGKKVSSTDSPELMGAFGAALYARKKWLRKPDTVQSSLTLPDMDVISPKELQCKGCTNKCSVLRFKFPNGNTCYAGNKCEKVFYNTASAKIKGHNAFDSKNDALFNSGFNIDKTLNEDKGLKVHDAYKRTVIGIPRVLNMFENFPFWNALFTECGFKVELSPESSFSLYQKGVGSVMSDNICFPAKLVHGHILALVEKGVDRIFYPIIPKEEKEFGASSNSYNCPVVSGYPDVVRSSMEPEEKYGIPFDKPVITLSNIKILERSCLAYISSLGVESKIFKRAFAKALSVREETRKRIVFEQKELFVKAVENDELVFVVAGRPYHSDPLINQKIGQIISDLGAHAFTDDVFRKDDSAGFGLLKIVSQWSYPNRVIQAAMEVAKLPKNVQLIQLNSFGCGPDSFFMDETREILSHAGKNHTVLRIDEIASPGSVRLRLRSLAESLKASLEPQRKEISETVFKDVSIPYTKQDRGKTILAPWFSDFISPFIPALGELAGYNIVNLPRSTKESADNGLKYGNNEVCYPSTLVLGDIITALQSEKYDLDDIVVAITQTGGQCRATNYISQIKNGLQSAGFGNIPVIALAAGKVYQNDQKAFKIPFMKILNITIHTLLYADALQQMYGSVVIREKNAGETQQLFDFYIDRGTSAARRNDHRALTDLLTKAVSDFNTVKVFDKQYTKVGLIGEIYVKYNNFGQAYTTQWLRSKGIDVVTPPIIDFLMQYFVNSQVNIRNGVSSDSLMGKLLRPLFWKYMNDRIRIYEGIMKKFDYYTPSESIYTKAEYASDILDLSNQFGEGWSLAAEVAHYARHGVKKIVCVQPFGCIANHIIAKGVEKRIKKLYPDVDMLYLDVDGGTAEVNMQNRLHFLMGN